MPGFDEGHFDNPDNVFVDVFEEEPLTPEEVSLLRNRDASRFIVAALLVWLLLEL